MAEKNGSTTLGAMLTWNGGAPRPVTLHVTHAPEVKDAESDHMPKGGTFHDAPSYPKFVPAPDYSTAEAVTARCLERGTRDTFFLEVMRLAGAPGTYKAFRKAVEKSGGELGFVSDVRDSYTSKWSVVPNPDWETWRSQVTSYGEGYVTRPNWPEPPRYTLALSEVAAHAAPVAKIRTPRKSRLAEVA